MSDRPYVKPNPVLTNGDMSGNLTSSPSALAQKSMVSYGVSWVGSSPEGTISIQCSNDYSQNSNGSTLNAGTWSTMTVLYNGALVTTVPVSGNTGSGMIDITATSVYATRLIYTAGSGTGTMQVLLTAKVQ